MNAVLEGEGGASEKPIQWWEKHSLGGRGDLLLTDGVVFDARSGINRKKNSSGRGTCGWDLRETGGLGYCGVEVLTWSG